MDNIAHSLKSFSKIIKFAYDTLEHIHTWITTDNKYITYSLNTNKNISYSDNAFYDYILSDDINLSSFTNINEISKNVTVSNLSVLNNSSKYNNSNFIYINNITFDIPNINMGEFYKGTILKINYNSNILYYIITNVENTHITCTNYFSDITQLFSTYYTSNIDPIITGVIDNGLLKSSLTLKSRCIFLDNNMLSYNTNKSIKKGQSLYVIYNDDKYVLCTIYDFIYYNNMIVLLLTDNVFTNDITLIKSINIISYISVSQPKFISDNKLTIPSLSYFNEMYNDIPLFYTIGNCIYINDKASLNCNFLNTSSNTYNNIDIQFNNSKFIVDVSTLLNNKYYYIYFKLFKESDILVISYDFDIKISDIPLNGYDLIGGFYVKNNNIAYLNDIKVNPEFNIANLSTTLSSYNIIELNDIYYKYTTVIYDNTKLDISELIDGIDNNNSLIDQSIAYDIIKDNIDINNIIVDYYIDNGNYVIYILSKSNTTNDIFKYKYTTSNIDDINNFTLTYIYKYE